MHLVINEGNRQVQQFTCACCNTEAERTWADVYDGNTALAVYFASCYHHGGVHEAWIDAILGSWGDNQFDDHITFGCRVGPVEGSPAPAKVVDTILEQDVLVRRHVYGRGIEDVE